MFSFFNQFDWQALLSALFDKCIALILLWIGYFIVKHIVLKYSKLFYKKYIMAHQGSESRSLTLYTLCENTIHYVLYFFLGYGVLNIIGVPIATLVAGAGIAGLVIGLGAQGFINDFINGFFILIERQFDVDDLVIISGVEGIVTSIGVRLTTIEGLDGTMHYIRNREIAMVNNLSRGSRRIFINIYLKDPTQITQITQIITDVNTAEMPNLPSVIGTPVQIGLQTNPSGRLYYGVIVYAKQGTQADIQHYLYAKYIEALQAKNIQLFT